MNFSLLACKPLASRHHETRDDEANEWLGGEAWVAPPPFNIERFGVIDTARADDPASEWIPL